MKNNLIFTIGHSTHRIEHFVDLLNKYSINCIVDVRSVAASGFNPQFNKEPLSKYLNKSKITYLHFADEFGARKNLPELLDEEGRVDFEKVRHGENFLLGVERLKSGITKGYTIALMCSEADPFDCHRFSLISVFLERECIEVRHILREGTIMTSSELEKKLLKRYDEKIKSSKAPIFDVDVSLNFKLAMAYRLRNKEVAYSPYRTEQVEQL